MTMQLIAVKTNRLAINPEPTVETTFTDKAMMNALQINHFKFKLFTFGWLHNFLRAVIYAKTLDCFASSDSKRLT